MNNVKEEAINELSKAIGASKEATTKLLEIMILSAKLEILAEKVKSA